MINLIFGMEATILYVHNVCIFLSFRKIILGVLKKWSSEAAINFEINLSDRHFRLTSQFTVILISNTASDGD